MKQMAIYCPDCAGYLCSIDPFQTMAVIRRCECGNYYRVDPIRHKAVKTNRPERNTSSGATFW